MDKNIVICKARGCINPVEKDKTKIINESYCPKCRQKLIELGVLD